MSEYPHPMFDEQGKVVCQLCGKSYLVISPRHLGTHKIKYDEYKLRFPDAPLSSEEFNASSKYGKEKTLFVEKEMDKFEDDEPLPDEKVEEIIVNEDPDIDEEIDLSMLIETDKKENDVMARSKNAILDHLRVYFTNIEKDYLIDQYGTDNKLKFHFITDFCDPVLKIVIQFPKTFWHNQEIGIDPNKNLKLEQYGWKVIEFNKPNPSLKEITNMIESL
jgi:hypothetical protein